LEADSSFRKFYSKILNSCINERYRKNGFNICYVIFEDSPISKIINIHQTDRIIEAELDFKTHTTPQPNGNYNYPNPEYILNQLPEAKTIRIAGFHLWDCVQKFAETSYKRGLDTLVDEDLTELFLDKILDTNFRVDKYPTLNPREGRSQLFFELFMKAIENRPWMWQDY
jgi:hypothetical protein